MGSILEAATVEFLDNGVFNSTKETSSASGGRKETQTRRPQLLCVGPVRVEAAATCFALGKGLAPPALSTAVSSTLSSEPSSTEVLSREPSATEVLTREVSSSLSREALSRETSNDGSTAGGGGGEEESLEAPPNPELDTQVRPIMGYSGYTRGVRGLLELNPGLGLPQCKVVVPWLQMFGVCEV